jgi:UDP-N-acetyl-2-amino-2-deoxyglucuronate dehydrogenase
MAAHPAFSKGSTMERIRTGLVGCGKVGHLHAKALKYLPESNFTAVYDADVERARHFAEQYGVKVYSDAGEMVAAGHVEAVNICTPHPLHASPAIAAMRAGAHVIIEKPLASTLEDCDAMLEVGREAKVKMSTISQRRFFAPCQRIRQAIDEGKLSAPILGSVIMYGWRDQPYYTSDPWRGQWQSEGGGVLVNQSPHQLDLLQWYMGPIEELFGYWRNLNHPYIEVEDTAIAVLRFKNGGLGTILVSNSQNPALYCRVVVHGSNGASVAVQTDGGAMFVAGMSNISEPPINTLWTIPGDESLLEQWRKEDEALFQKIDTTLYYHQLQIQDFLRAILEDREPYISGEEGRKTVEIFTAIYRSQRDHAPVKFPVMPETGRHDFDGRLSAR